jgi:hypothetical protein
VAIPSGGPDAPVMTVPAFPQLKLWPDSATAITGDASTLPRLAPGEDKRAHRVTDCFASSPRQLARLFVLDHADAPAHAAPLLSPGAAFIEIVRHAYGARTFDPTHAPRRFMQIARVAATVPVHRLVARHGFAHLPALAALIESAVDGHDDPVER